MRPLLLGLCYNGGEKSVVVIDTQKQLMSTGLLIIQKKASLWRFFIIWTVVKDSLTAHFNVGSITLVLYFGNVIISFHYCASMLATAVARGIMFSSCQTVRPILVNMISEKHLEGSSLNLAQTSTWPFLIENE